MTQLTAQVGTFVLPIVNEYGDFCVIFIETSMSEENNHELDLPLLSNNDEINVYHYVLDLACQLKEKKFEGAITIFCKPGAESEKKSVSIESTQDRGR